LKKIKNPINAANPSNRVATRIASDRDAHKEIPAARDSV
jgi:hypothetical protein